MLPVSFVPVIVTVAVSSAVLITLSAVASATVEETGAVVSTDNTNAELATLSLPAASV